MMSGEVPVERPILSLALADIAIGARIGFYHADHAAGLAESMASDGQHDPIHVRRNGNAAKQPWTLIAGRHRIGAATSLGWTHINAIQIADANTDRATLLRMELSENLDHRNPRPIERALFIQALAELEEAADHPGHEGERSQDRAIRVRWKNAIENRSENNEIDTVATIAAVSDWQKRTAIAVGCSERTLRLYRAIYSQVISPFIDIRTEKLPDFIEQLNAHPLGESLSAMTRIAQIKERKGRQLLIEAITADLDHELQTLDAAMVAAEISTSKGTRVREAAKPYNSFIGALGRMAAAERKAVAIEFAENVAPEVAKAMMKAFLTRGII